VPVTVPDGPAVGCSRLHAGLPSSLAGRDARDVTPASRRTAAWGSPAVTLRCGVERPAGLGKQSQLVVVDGVGWYLRSDDPPFVFTAVDRVSYVEVRVPRGVPRSEATAPLADLASSLKRALPPRAAP
jgi:hypothetical protein